MYNSLLPDELKDFEYYVKKIPLYLRNDEAFLSHFKIWFDLLKHPTDDSKGILNAGNKLFEYLDITNSQYDPNAGIEGDNPFLDIIGELFGLSRNIIMTTYSNFAGFIQIEQGFSDYSSDVITLDDYTDGQPNFSKIPSVGDWVTFQYGVLGTGHDYSACFVYEVIDKTGTTNTLKKIGTGKVSGEVSIIPVSLSAKLDNGSFLSLIKTKIIQNNFDGTNKQVQEYYNKIGLPVYYITTEPATVEAYLNSGYLITIPGLTSKAIAIIQALFMSGDLLLKSMGIYYTPVIGDIATVLHWDAEGTDYGWDWGTWI